MRKLRKSMLFALLLAAVVSCGGGGGGAGSGSDRGTNTPTPIPTPSVNIGSRTIKTDLTKLNGGILETIDYNIVGEDMSSGGNKIAGKTNYDVKNNEIAYLLNNPNIIDFVTPVTANIKSGGIAIETKASGFISNPQNRIREILTQEMNNAHNLTLNMEPGSFLFMINGETMNLSDTDITNIFSATPASSMPTINGTRYKNFKFDDSNLTIDQNVNLDDSNDLYNKLSIVGSNIVIKENKSINGTQNNQIAIKTTEASSSFQNIGISEIVFSTGMNILNYGTINLRGDNSIGMYLINTNTYNKGTISVGKNSVGIYENVDDEDKYYMIYNDGKILLGEGSAGIYYNGEEVSNSNIGRGGIVSSGNIESASNNAIGIMGNITINKNFSDILISNFGEIKLTGDKSVGMNITGKSTSVQYNFTDVSNKGKIIMGDSSDRANPSIGMYNDNLKINLNNSGEIQIGKNSIGISGNGTNKVSNSGNIYIMNDGGVGMYLINGSKGTNNGTITTVGTPKDAVGVVVGKDAEFTNNGKIYINSEGGAGIVVAGGVVKNYGDIEVSGGAVKERIDNMRTIQILSNRVKQVNSDLGIYVDTLGRTKPIEGLSNLGLQNADLLIGAEATEKTNATEVTVGNEVLEPFNKSIQSSNIANWNVKTGSLVWEADSKIENNKVSKVTLKKQSYAKFADSETTVEVAKGLDEKYTETAADSKDKQIFNYLNSLNDTKALGNTYHEINGSQYINVQQRIAQTDNILENKLLDLQKDNSNKSGHHVSTFFRRDNHDPKTLEIPDSHSTAYGISYLFSNADLKQGIYAGTVINKFKFKDNGRSRENVTMFKLGAYKTFNLNDLEWTLSGDGFASQNDMKRRFVIGNKVYENKADYNTYGFAIKNELGKTFQVGENVTVKPYAALKLGYGKFTNIKEKDGTLNMEVKGNNFYSVKPALGVEVGYSAPIMENSKFKASLGLGYEHELGKIEDNVNEAKFANTNTKINLKGAKDERRGNFKSNLKVGFEAGNFNFSVNGGYDTKDKNSHVGMGLGVSF